MTYDQYPREEAGRYFEIPMTKLIDKIHTHGNGQHSAGS